MATPLFNRFTIELDVAEDILSTRINEQLMMLCEAQAAAHPNTERTTQISDAVDALFAARRRLGALDPAGVQQAIAFYGAGRDAKVH